MAKRKTNSNKNKEEVIIEEGNAEKTRNYEQEVEENG